MKKVQFLHHNTIANEYCNLEYEKKRTFVFELPDYYAVEAEILKTVQHSDYIPKFYMNIGIAKCNPKDQYNKTIGREIALSKIQLKTFYIKRIETDSDSNEIVLILEGIGLEVTMVLRKSFENVRIIQVREV